MKGRFAVARLVAPLAAVLAAAPPARAEASGRAQVVRQVLPSSVRVQLVSRGEVQRTATGVVVWSGSEAGGARSYVLTNAHVLDPGDFEKVTYRVLVERRGRVEKTLAGKLAGLGSVPDLDLGLLRLDEELPAAPLGSEETIGVGDDVVVVGAPYGKALSVSGGMISQLEAEPDTADAPLRFVGMKTDAAIGYGSSGGGVFSVPGGRLVGLVEGYRTARVVVGGGLSFDVPMPGETFVAPVTKIRGFLEKHLAAMRPVPPARAVLAAPVGAVGR